MIKWLKNLKIWVFGMSNVEITSRNSVRGREFIFRFNDRLYVFKTKKEAEVKLMELQGGSLF